MEPFKITCVTCRARLAVRNEALIGQILACPKCGSMVQVAAPAAGGVGDSTSERHHSGRCGADCAPVAAARRRR